VTGIVVTRAEDEDGPLTKLLEEAGARVLHWGTIRFAPPEDPAPLHRALGELDHYHWVAFSSPRAVEAVTSRVPEPPPDLRVAAVGSSTARSLEQRGWPVHRVPESNRGDALVEVFRRAGDAGGTRVLFPASAIAREVVPRGLEELGARVDRVTAYRTVSVDLDAESCRTRLERGEVGVITFASPSAGESLERSLGPKLMKGMKETLPAAAIGPTTGRALRESGWRRVVVAEPHTLESLARTAVEAAGARDVP
jgi:uroporphyrinogen-III synthase